MNEVKRPKKTLIYYYVIVLLILLLFNFLFIIPSALQTSIFNCISQHDISLPFSKTAKS